MHDEWPPDSCLLMIAYHLGKISALLIDILGKNSDRIKSSASCGFRWNINSD